MLTGQEKDVSCASAAAAPGAVAERQGLETCQPGPCSPCWLPGGSGAGGGLGLSHSSIVPRRPDARGRAVPAWPVGDGSTQGCAQGEGKGMGRMEEPGGARPPLCPAQRSRVEAQAEALGSSGLRRPCGHLAWASSEAKTWGKPVRAQPASLPPWREAFSSPPSRVSSGSRKEETQSQGEEAQSQGEEAGEPEETGRLDGEHCAGQPGMARLWVLFCLQLLPWAWGSAQELDAAGRNVCADERVPTGLACCPGWRQEGRECPAALCEGEDACAADEVCVKPGVCRCKPGFFGAHCSSRCPEQYWGPDCKQSCLCHPHGKCNPATGHCTCYANRWGPLCQFPCPCGPHGRCHPLTGACLCEPGWWAPTCKRQCQCNLSGSRCDPATGQCLCAQGWWGRRCGFPCSCHLSPCAQDSGKCECKVGSWGPSCQHQCDCLHGSCSPLTGSCTCSPGYQGRSCRDPCPAGHYGPQCRHSCGHCKRSQPCSPTDGLCLACEPGWNGTLCNQPCLPGHHGENCSQACPQCRGGETCHPETGTCQDCDPGWTGPSCNETCRDGFFGVNCSSPCPCAGGPCHPLSGDCAFGSRYQGALIAGVLVPLLLLLLCVACCCCCGTGPVEARDRAAVADADVLSRMKHHVQGVLANLSSMLPCFSLGGYKLPRVTVSHHDAEIPFNPSFIEQPSAAWASDSSFSSFDSDDDGPAYSVPALAVEDVPAGSEPQEGGSPGNELPDATAFNSEEVSQPFIIPRTSSIAKAKRPSVSFAEGTKFGPQCRSGSVEMPSASRKPKASWGLPKPPLADADESAQPGGRPNDYENAEPIATGEDGHRPSPRSTPGGRRRVVPSTRHVAQRVEALEAASKLEQNITTIYMTVGTARRGTRHSGGGQGSGEGPVQAVLKRLGSFQRGKRASKEEPKVRRGPESIQKPPRRALGQERVSTPTPPQQGEGTKGLGLGTAESPAEHQQHGPGQRPSPIPAPPGLWAADAQGEDEAERSEGPEQAGKLEANGQAAAEEEEPKYENVTPYHSSLPRSPSGEPPATTAEHEASP
ncbi:PREDICTED: scavenger receptor class F member 1 isoform X2 [Gavialis gangeticus]|uniref:scavenger receptor class F member 1 isoform X2 n=1 Tax=Gavialis gangeticus TaxID=94835 RepID=UPI00092EC094|nr:PREDICTED: scavenger receptor class F member 1 isoform X2 [Gavialis gangeticus]